jgi:hypothetical protein
LNVANNPRHLSPESRSLAVDAGALAGDADVLAGKSASHDVNSASVGSSIEGSDVAEYRERRERAVGLTSRDDVSAVAVNLDGADAAVSEQLTGEDAASGAGE